jgi:hypothetical protein
MNIIKHHETNKKHSPLAFVPQTNYTDRATRLVDEF